VLNVENGIKKGQQGTQASNSHGMGRGCGSSWENQGKASVVVLELINGFEIRGVD